MQTAHPSTLTEEQEACEHTTEGEEFPQGPSSTPQRTPSALLQALSPTLQFGLAEETELPTQPQGKQAEDIKTTASGEGWAG